LSKKINYFQPFGSKAGEAFTEPPEMFTTMVQEQPTGCFAKPSSGSL